MSKSPQSSGRKANAAQPLGELPGLKSRAGQAKTAARARVAAGPDGPDAGVVGKTFKSPAGAASAKGGAQRRRGAS